MNARALARALGGEVAGPTSVRAPGPGRRPSDRSMIVHIDAHAPNAIRVQSTAGDDPKTCEQLVVAALGSQGELL